jgi:hypothetical protein
MHPARHAFPRLAMVGLCVGLTGCATIEGTVALVAAVATPVLARVPGSEIEQTYYLGAFDDEDQLAPTVYRVTVRGQASVVSGVGFGSGWVPADIIDSLTTSVGSDVEGRSVHVEQGPAATEVKDELTIGRGLVVFGPEGFRPAPRKHRLVIVMGASPQDFFRAMDELVGMASATRAGRLHEGVYVATLEQLNQVKDERRLLDKIATQVGASAESGKGGVR